MKNTTAKTLRTIILVAWTIVMASMLVVIQKVAGNVEQQKTISTIIVGLVLFSAVLAGVVYRLTKIIKDSSREQ